MFTALDTIGAFAASTSATEIGTSLSASGLIDSLSHSATLYALILVSIPLAIARGITMSKRIDL